MKKERTNERTQGIQNRGDINVLFDKKIDCIEYPQQYLHNKFRENAIKRIIEESMYLEAIVDLGGDQRYMY